MFVALGFAIFGLVARYLPIFPEEEAHAPAVDDAGVRAWRAGGTSTCRRLTNSSTSRRASFASGKTAAVSASS